MTDSAEFDAAFALAREALSAGSFTRAAQLFECCTALQPDHPVAWFLLGACLDRCGKLLNAAQAFARAEELDSSHPQAANAQAAMLSALGRHEEALAAFRRALALNSGDPQILTNIGITSEKLGKEQEALDCYAAALTASPDHLGALSNRGVLLLKLKQAQQALTDHLRFVACAPASAIGHYNCAETYAALDRDQDAIAACDAALALEPAHVKALFLRGVLISGAGRLDQGIAALATAQKIDPQKFAALMETANLDTSQAHAVNVRNIYCLRGLDRLRACDWHGYADFIETLQKWVHAGAENPAISLTNVGIPFPVLSLPVPQQIQLMLARQIAARIAAGRPPAAQALSSRSTEPRPLRIGYVSPDYNNHAMGHLMRSFFRLHDRQAFGVYAYSIRAAEDCPIRQEIIAGCDVFRDVAGWATSDITDLIRRDGIDILIDLAGYTAHARPEIFASRPVPLSISYLGYPGSSGADCIDYFITNRIASPPEQAQHYSEKMIYVQDNLFPYPQNHIAPAQSRTSYGLPQDAFVFCGFNNSYKIEPGIFAVWMRLLQRVPRSVLWLLSIKPSAEKNLLTAAAEHGIDPARVIFAPLLPLPEHLPRYQVADLFLDTFLYGAGTTGMDALWAGLPFLTCPGETFASRFGASHLAALGMPELIAASPAEYEERAFYLATHPAELQAIRHKLAEQRMHAPLFKTQQLVRQLEAAYQEAWNRHQTGLPPAHIEVH